MRLPSGKVSLTIKHQDEHTNKTLARDPALLCSNVMYGTAEVPLSLFMYLRARLVSVSISPLRAGRGPCNFSPWCCFGSPWAARERLAVDDDSEVTDHHRRLEMPCLLTSSRNLQRRQNALRAGHLEIQHKNHTHKPWFGRCCR